jgi:hypothetical protein
MSLNHVAVSSDGHKWPQLGAVSLTRQNKVQAKAIPFDAESAASGKWMHRLLGVSFLGITAVAMVGWLTALGWAAISVTKWLFF